MGDVTAKLLSRDYDVFQIVWVSSLASLPVLVAAAPWMGGLKRSIITKSWRIQSFRALLNLVTGLLAIYGFSMLPMAKVYTLFFCAPFFTSILSIPILKEHVGWHRWLAISVGFFGVLVALRPGAIPLDPASIGILFAAAMIALINLLVRVMDDRETSLSFAMYPVLLRCIVLAPFGLILSGLPSAYDAFLFIASGVSAAFGFICVALAFRFAPASVASPFHYTQIVWGITLGYLLFGDIPDRWTLTGAAIIVISGLYIIYRENRPQTAAILPANAE